MIIVLSGALVPLPLFPDWLQPALALQPFAGLVDIPFGYTAETLADPRRSQAWRSRRSG